MLLALVEARRLVGGALDSVGDGARDAGARRRREDVEVGALARDDGGREERRAAPAISRSARYVSSAERAAIGTSHLGQRASPTFA
ncbi:MAG: hypothetical protein V9G15_06140 [Dermatophilaceae bacterium]